MKTLLRCCVAALALTVTLTAAAQMGGQMGGMDAPGGKMPSPPATAETTLAGKSIVIHYNTPSIRGRKIFGGLVPYGEVWRTGANPATTLITPVDLVIGDLKVPAGTYTLFTLPLSEREWKLIVSTKTGEWGIPYPAGSDLGRTPMQITALPAPQEVMSISFEHTVKYSTELHIRWENTDVWVHVADIKDAPRIGGVVSR